MKGKQNIFIIMFKTPQKASIAATEPNSLLKAAIEQKLSLNQQKKEQNNMKIIKDIEINKDELNLLELIESNESQAQRGYYRYENWVNFNTEKFTNVSQQTVLNFWKILRIINHGEVVIPTGLIYEISYYLLLKNTPQVQSTSGSLKQVINQFLRMNKTNQFINNFRELSNYPTFQQIQRQYCPNFNKETKMNTQKIPEKAPGKHLYDRLHNEGRKREQSIRQLKYASMAKELSQCKFTPNITKYNSKAQTQAKKCQRVCRFKHIQKVQQKQTKYKFMARQIDKKIYNARLNEVPGVLQHIKRTQFSQAERQRIKRMTNRSWLMIR